MERRKFIKTSLTAGVGLGLLGGLYYWKIEPFWLDFNRVKMPIKKNFLVNLQDKFNASIALVCLFLVFKVEKINLLISLQKGDKIEPPKIYT